NWRHNFTGRSRENSECWCISRPQLAGNMSRTKSNGETYYFFPINAFRFPGSDDVYFTCAVDISTNYNFPEICPAMRNDTRLRRASNKNDVMQLELFDSVAVQLSEQGDNHRPHQGVSATTTTRPCFNKAILFSMALVNVFLIVSLVLALTVYTSATSSHACLGSCCNDV
uniref:ZP domain-containing protein n=1 Tax=Parascaris univalens TaxID=6257 RepID=A0A915AL08_PARUN